MIEILSSLIYQLVESSWHISAILIKYYLVILTVLLYRDQKLSTEKYREKIINQSPNILSTIAIIGGLTMLAGITLRPFIPLFSELTALIYLAYLFWEF